MSRILWLFLLLFPASAMAQGQTAQPVIPGTMSQSGCPSAALTPCFVPGVGVSPAATAPPTTGFGTVAAINASALLSTLTTGPNSAAWPTTPGMVYVKNAGASAGTIYVCSLGGTCTAATGLPLELGASWGFNKPAAAMTIIAASTASVSAQW